ncbi:hypothetical protein ACSQ67_010330 [Phaseolus vulgaris]
MTCSHSSHSFRPSCPFKDKTTLFGCSSKTRTIATAKDICYVIHFSFTSYPPKRSSPAPASNTHQAAGLCSTHWVSSTELPHISCAEK